MQKLVQDLNLHGFVPFCSLQPDSDENLPTLNSGKPVKSLLIVGNAGSEIWPKFSRGWQQFQASDPLDYWTESKLREVATAYDFGVIFPFEGSPYYPFQRWALKSNIFSQSPLGVLIHKTYGPWLAFRGAFLSSEVIHFSQDSGDTELCKSCVDKPCLTVCPVDAVSLDNGYDASACRAYLRSESEAECHIGCKARCACPYGKNFRYDSNHARFHMSAFLKNSL